MKFAQVIVDISLSKLDKPFTYIVPEELEDTVEAGMQVAVPFGRRKIKGYIVALNDSCDIPVDRLRPIIKIIDNSQNPAESQVLSRQVRLAYWMKTYYGSTMNQAIRTVIPSGKSAGPKMRKVVHAISDRDALNSELASLMSRKGHSIGKERLISELLVNPDIPWDELVTRLSIPASAIRDLEKKGFLTIEEIRSYRNPLGSLMSDDKTEGARWSRHQLNDDQQAIADDFADEYDRGIRRTYLIYGVTGSGKTEVYMDMIEHVLSAGRQVIVLIPEISLTFQTVMRFYLRFGDQVSIINSRMSPSERLDQYERASKGEISIVVGPRSALFTPFNDIGLIVIDEEHESSYKSGQVPKYHARETAIELARLCRASVVLGSATPSVTAYSRASAGTDNYKLYTLPQRAGAGTLPQVHIIDLRQELKKGNRSILSVELNNAISERLRRHEQVMLFLNRRGMAGFVSCRSCGEVIKCPHCDVSLSLHRDGRLHCHYCGYTAPFLKACPKCGSKLIGTMKAGTEKVEEKLHELYPEARILRMDADTTKGKSGHQKILEQFANEEADILVGTQMIVKGHDFPKVTLMGVLAADMSLNESDYRSAERTFDLLQQAAGRAGRGDHPGDAYFQTYQPDHYAIRAAAAGSYEDFYRNEIAYRKLMQYPPAGHLLQIEITSTSNDNADNMGRYLKEILEQSGTDAQPAVKPAADSCTILGPTDAGIVKLNDIYRKVIIVKSSDYDALVRLKDRAADAVTDGNSPSGADVWFDFDPMDSF